MKIPPFAKRATAQIVAFMHMAFLFPRRKGMSICCFHEFCDNCIPPACQRRTAQADSGLAGALGFFHHDEYLCPPTVRSSLRRRRLWTECNFPKCGRFWQHMGNCNVKMRGIKQRADFSTILERSAENRPVFGAGRKNKTSSNPHGCWMFCWRRCGDLNPSAGGTDLPDFESGPFNHLGTSPYKIPMKGTFCE